MNDLHISAVAQSDPARIKAHIEQEPDNPGAALATLRGITKRIRILKDHAYPGSRLSSIADMESDYRFLVSGNYLIFCRVYGKDVYVDRVLYGRRDYLRALFEDSLSGDPEE